MTGITRVSIHKILDEQLTKMGYGEAVNIERGAIHITIQIENNKVSLTVRERELTK
ncbi:MAG: hypothetical protein IMZ53_14620 [Thermoplasmata archaeon]|nr:hypothetical protein [Thermoplasmata archaeon]